MCVDFLNCFENIHFHKLLWLLFGQLLEKFGLLYILASGHTGTLQHYLSFKVNSIHMQVDVGFSLSMFRQKQKIMKHIRLSSGNSFKWI